MKHTREQLEKMSYDEIVKNWNDFLKEEQKRKLIEEILKLEE